MVRAAGFAIILATGFLAAAPALAATPYDGEWNGKIMATTNMGCGGYKTGPIKFRVKNGEIEGETTDSQDNDQTFSGKIGKEGETKIWIPWVRTRRAKSNNDSALIQGQFKDNFFSGTFGVSSCEGKVYVKRGNQSFTVGQLKKAQRQAVAVPVSTIKSARKQIEELKELLDAGLIEKKDYDVRRKTILDRAFGPKEAENQVALTAPAAPGSTPAPAIPDLDFGKYYALVIGIADYINLPKLKTSVNDAQSVARMLKSNYGFDVNLLLDPVRDEIIDALDDFRAKLKPGDNFLLYYAGHGWLDEDADRGYWLPKDAKTDRRSRWVSNATITDSLKSIVAKHVMIVADSCYSGTLSRGVNIKLKTSKYLEKMISRRARVALTSGGLEPVSDSEGGANSPFATALLDALSANTGVLEGTKLFGEIRRPVMLNAQQTPEYSDVRNAGHDGGDFLFVRRR